MSYKSASILRTKHHDTQWWQGKGCGEGLAVRHVSIREDAAEVEKQADDIKARYARYFKV